ncbi:TetR/AcrR family transcriptional regulator [Mycobacterium intracellulare]|uniref:TetR/AcrR family transcriptional regulator n=1 Tax=Mycobacterium intracellulare TaxID=1767 RepID=UPI000BAC21B0|nr:TetR/AcrR family transcriptional regulator [Mycobacterium intracellulare]ASW98565.1 TetR family transcriptional regulator [Mycobacterium intracellulare subsp. chimaera]PBA60209.1 TetR family transcriptional regulator [Mycobacterium intracellulare subsp. chimaera]
MDQRRVRGERNRNALIAAAVALFSARGYEGTTVEQIAAEAGVAPRTLFHHFASKDDILFDGYAGRLDEATRRFRASESSSLWGALAEASNAVAEAISQQPEMFLVRAQMYAGHPALRATMLRLNDEWIDQLTGEVARWLGADADTDLRPRLAATVINGANRAAIDTWVAGGGADDLVEIMQSAVDLVRPSIARIESTVARTRARQIG